MHAWLLWMAAVLLFTLPHPAQALDFDDLALEGELRFLSTRPDPGAYRYESRVQITADSLQTGIVRLTTCHRQLDPIARIDIVFNKDRVQTIDVISNEGVGQVQVDDGTVALTDVQRNGSICIALSSRAPRPAR